MSRVPIGTAAWDAAWEADLVARLEAGDSGVVVVRRCVDAADLIAAAEAGIIRAALISTSGRWLDLDLLDRLAGCGVAVVGVVTSEDAERRARQLGLRRLCRPDDDARALTAAVVAALAEVRELDGRSPRDVPFDGADAGGQGADAGGQSPYSAGGRSLQPMNESGGQWVPDVGEVALPAPEPSAVDGDEPVGGRFGELVAVWGPTGAPGRTAVAIGLATELAVLGFETLLVDADSYGGSIAQTIGLLDEAPGLVAAVRQANAGALDVPALARLAPYAHPGVRVLSGIARPDRWPELRGPALRSVYACARRLARMVVVDCGFCLEDDDELSYDTLAPRRNAATLATLDEADHIVAVGSADPVGVQRLLRGLDRLREIRPDPPLTVVVNKLRVGPIAGGNPEEQIRAALERYAGLRDICFVPDDRTAFDRALARGRTVREVAPRSSAVRAFHALARRFAPVSPRPTHGARRRRERAVVGQ